MKVLDKGSLELVDSMGSDTTVVNAARVSFAKHVDEITPKDERLITYLATHSHISPFYHPHVMMRVKAPISVQRQWLKHKIGTAENSESTRYVEVLEEFYVPDVFRAQSDNNKQASCGVVENQKGSDLLYRHALATSYKVYRELLDYGVAREQAREVLPLCTYTSWYWTASLAAVAHFIRLRDDDHAQFEIRQYAIAMKAIVEEVFPVSLKSLLGG